MQAAEARGKEEGIEIGEARGKVEIACKMLIKGKDIEEIIELTGLSAKEIESRKHK